MNKDQIILGAKIVLSVLFLLSLGMAYHYETDIKGHYQNNPEAYERDSQKVLSYLNSKGCSSISEVSEALDFGHLQARYLLHKLSKEKMLLKYPNRGICLSLQGEVESLLQKNQ